MFGLFFFSCKSTSCLLSSLYLLFYFCVQRCTIKKLSEREVGVGVRW